MADIEEYIWSAFRCSVKYGDVNPSMQFGMNWEFVAAPEAPALKQLTLQYESLCYYSDWDAAGEYLVPNKERSPATNMWLLEAFYTRHLRHKKFKIATPGYGYIYCRFKEPLEIPDGIVDGYGWTENFEVVLQEVR
ncbi:hypothetical protein D3877_23385 [Azospirillum cavernae]|uniref:Uncharacterized protein n=1 Tax=Azospirillum cavernae TaxID=2320860 RepID=A0A418VP98_9PROT|nr:hypothetical protein [Azospirillum cavernae]RJF78076.1 hypothetical protein D3877_23385 [Azospirillum cavernae]